MKSYLAGALLLFGCAEAGRKEGKLGERPDGGTRPDAAQVFDAPSTQRDAPMSGGGTMTLVQTTSQADSGAAIACGDGATYTARNSYYRVFALSDYSITTAFSVSKVDFGVSLVQGAPNLKVSVGTYSGTPGGTLTTNSISLAPGGKTLTPGAADTTESVSLSATIPAGSNVIVEIDQTNNGSTDGSMFYIAANASGETKPGYISSPDCGAGSTTPTSMTTVAGAEADMVVTVTGTY